ncbi:unnamed protein product [Rhizoctonia solani]|uniref:ATP-dependent RNA helicase n=2 Tax=Rhizoctonia solani TaxID=456999 RepID=A0A8H3HUV3_9AGAM|nr:unnamed protein product [Rhizoctonia solani]
MRNVPKLKELNYAQWKNITTNSIKKAKLWEYVDGSIEEPAEHDAGNLATYYDEAAAVSNAILGSLEPAAQKYIEEALVPRDAWLALEKTYLTAEADTDSKLVSIEQQLANLRLDEGGDVIEHIAEFGRMRCQLNGTRLAIDDQTCISMLYRSLPPSYRQSVLTPEGTEMKDFSALCTRLTYLSQRPEPADNTPSAATEDYTTWGVPEDIKAFGLTGDKNPLLAERAAVTCRDCLLKDHKAGTPECPQYEWRKELWGTQQKEGTLESFDKDLSTKRPPANSKRLSYEFSEPVKVVLSFDELGLKPKLRQNLTYSRGCFPSAFRGVYVPGLILHMEPEPSAVQQCAILPIIQGRSVHVEAPSNSGKTTTLVISVLHVINTALPCIQALILAPTSKAVAAFQKIINDLGSGLSVLCSTDVASAASFTGINKVHIFVGTPEYVMGLARRNIVNMHKLRVLVLDDIHELTELGMEDQILEVYRHAPPLAQVVASSAVFSSSIPNAISKMLTDPLRILVHRNDGISIGTHFYVTIPENQKPKVLSASFLSLGVNGLSKVPGAVVTNYFLWYEIKKKKLVFSWSANVMDGRESSNSDEWQDVIQSFSDKINGIRANILRNGYYYDSYDRAFNIVLATTDATLFKARLPSYEVPLINYDAPSNVADYAKRLDRWHLADPKRSQMIITFITADTDEINVIRELESFYGVRAAELLWEDKSSRLR